MNTAIDRRYEIQTTSDEKDGTSFRITDRVTDSRVATCYLMSNAELVEDALNMRHRYNAMRCALNKIARTESEDPCHWMVKLARETLATVE